MSGKVSLERAQRTAEQVIKRLAPYCKRIQVAGSIRRKKPEVKDIEILLIPNPSESWQLNSAIKALGNRIKGGPKYVQVDVGTCMVDLFFATEQNWGTLLLIRTGSAENNIRLCTRARDLNMALHADGSGLFNAEDKRIAGDTEQSIYNALGLKYQEPWERR